MSLLKEFLRIDSDRRSAHDLLRTEATQRRSRIDELSAEAKRRRDEISMLEEGLIRLADDIGRVEQEILDIDRRRMEHDADAGNRKAEAVRARFGEDRKSGEKLGADFRNLRSEFHAEREKLLAQADTGRMMDNYFQIETFLKDSGQPIPDAARKALSKERTDLLARIGPLVAPPPSPDSIFRATLAYAALDGPTPRALVAIGLAEPSEPCTVTDLAATLLYGSYASAVERLGPGVPRPTQKDGVVVYDMPVTGRNPEEVALELFLAVEEGLKKAANAIAVRCELTGVFVEPLIAEAVFASDQTS
ncbi:MAG: hypothetical protein ABIT01_11785 [Thermoanaerobaculia bacterium]